MKTHRGILTIGGNLGASLCGIFGEAEFLRAFLDALWGDTRKSRPLHARQVPSFFIVFSRGENYNRLARLLKKFGFSRLNPGKIFYFSLE